MKERTGQRGQNESQIGEEKWWTCWCCRDQQRACRMAQASAEKLEHIGPEVKERVASVPQREQLGRAAFAKRKRNRAVCPDHQIMRGERVAVSESRTLARERGIRARAWSGKGGLHSERGHIPRRRGRANKMSLPRTSRRHERVSGRKSSPGRSEESWFHSKSGQT